MSKKTVDRETPGVVRLLLDGQQRITSLYGIVRGAPPAFFDGNARAFTDLYFHLGNAEFRFYQLLMREDPRGPLLMREDPLWINVSDLMQKGHAGLGEYITRLGQLPEFADMQGPLENAPRLVSSESPMITVSPCSSSP